MPQISASWNSKRVFITYRNPVTGVKEAGTWTADFTGRVTNTLSDGSKQVFRKGRIASGTLNTNEGAPSLDYDLPIVDDPDNSPQGGEIILTVAFTGGAGGQEIFHLSPLLSWPDAGTDLATILAPEIVPAAPPFVILGVRGGAAKLDPVTGEVLDADGDPVTGGGGGTSLTNYSQVTSLTGYPTVIAAGSTQAAARTAIAAADDAAVVKLTGAQTVAGVKTFSSAPVVPDASFAIAKTSGLQTALDGKQASGSYAAATHTHAQSDITNLSTTLAGKSDTSHTHAASGIVSGTFDIARTTPGVFVRVTWSGSVWQFNGANLSSSAGAANRPGGRADIYCILQGGTAANRPAWFADGDVHFAVA